MSAIAKVLERLPDYKQTGPDRYLAPCPGHEDRHPSFTIRETPDGTILVKCWAGCSADHVVASMGLEFKDLFPERPDNRPPLRPRERWIPRDVFRALADECFLLVVYSSALAAGKKLKEKDHLLLVDVARRFHAAALEVCRE